MQFRTHTALRILYHTQEKQKEYLESHDAQLDVAESSPTCTDAMTFTEKNHTQGMWNRLRFIYSNYAHEIQ